MELSRLSSSYGRLVADTSAIINFIATQCPADILRALPERLVITDIVADEIEDGRKKGRLDAEMLDELKKSGLIHIEALGDAGESVFERLVVGPASMTLDDGEAATIAYAVENSLGVIIDDYKARRICKQHFAGVPMRCSVEIFRHVTVQGVLGSRQLELAVLNALQIARMGVPAEHIDWVVGIIGDVNAGLCPSLPRRKREMSTLRAERNDAIALESNHITNR